MKIKNSIANFIEDNQDEYFCQFCTKPKAALSKNCECSGEFFKLRDFDFDTQFSICKTITEQKKTDQKSMKIKRKRRENISVNLLN
jgi:hypothetical protein